MYVTKEQIAAAREINLLTYLKIYEPEELVHFSGQTYVTRTHDSLKISNGKWYWWSQGIGGKTALDYCIKVRGLSLPEAVMKILGQDIPLAELSVQKETKKEPVQFQLPEKHVDCRRVFSYLYKSRGIDAEIINYCIKHELLYEDRNYHNCVFVGYDGSEAKYAAVRSTRTNSTFAGDAVGSDKRYAFAIPLQARSGELYVFESAIDALSYLTLQKMSGRDWRSINCLSLSGVYQAKKNGGQKLPAALEQYLKDNPCIREIILCLDRDAVGLAASGAIYDCLGEAYQVKQAPPDRGKDYNEWLQLEKGITGGVKTRGAKER